MTSAPVRTNWLMTRETLFSLPGMAEAETMTMSLARISSFLCSAKAMRERPLIGSPWLPVVMTVISLSS